MGAVVDVFFRDGNDRDEIKKKFIPIISVPEKHIDYSTHMDE